MFSVIKMPHNLGGMLVIAWKIPFATGTALGAPVDVPHDGAPAIGVPSHMSAGQGGEHKAQ